MTFKQWIASEAGQRALEYAESAPGAGLSMAWDAALEAAAVRVEADSFQHPKRRCHIVIGSATPAVANEVRKLRAF